ncbi:Pur operon repressor [Lentibacillus sp. JNUCC-1]|uniref:pur operon repressor n=1 Tax=Lentibacillus sp. JNUCC-1 TaxID=2654513 RepID=UPI0012E74B37|nr:pur operon repressor [Lentibacillus sp. JNUCC-1]MUV38019.1 Pur operon repressor [Lentibacillus sp. JNUCC-1]
MRRSQRLVVLTQFFLENPYTHIQLSSFVSRMEASKTSISEDLGILNDVFTAEGTGYLDITAGAQGGVKYIPSMSHDNIHDFIGGLCKQLEDPSRLLTGGYLYMSDILGYPHTVQQIGRTFASEFADRDIDLVMTVATKGIPLAYAVGQYLGVPVVIARRDPIVTEGSSVSINYISGATRKIQTMVLPKRSLTIGSNVCIVDDFMKAGGTITGMINLLKEFDANPSAIGVLAEADDEEDERIVEDYTSLIKIMDVDDRQGRISVQPGNIIQQNK